MTPPMPSISSVPCRVGDGARGENVHQLVEIERAVLAPRRHVGRKRRGKAPGRDALDLRRRDRPAERREQHAGIARRGGGGIEAGDHRLERIDRRGRRRANAGSGRRRRRSCRCRCRSR